ncbi:MAG: oxidoreductase [Bacteroidetes bacterium]|nr:MAG: oxidoreductase [Bacteroidota bacterium]
MSRRAFVTGGTGFVGLNLIEELLKADWEIYALHRATSNLKYLSSFNVTLLEGNIHDLDALSAVFPEDIDVVFHVASNTSVWSKNNEEQFRDNVIGTKNMVQCALDKKVGKFIYTSSIAAYGKHNSQVSEKTISNAESCGIHYCKTKYLAEQEIQKGVSQGLRAMILNPVHIIGRYDSSNWAQLILAVYNNDLPGIPSGTGMFCYVKDIVKAHISAIEIGGNGENYMLGGPEAGFKEVINEVQKILGINESGKVTPNWVLKLGMHLFMFGSLFSSKEPQLTPEKYEMITGKMICDYSKAEKELGYQITPLALSLRESYEWLKKENLL